VSINFLLTADSRVNQALYHYYYFIAF